MLRYSYPLQCIANQICLGKILCIVVAIYFIQYRREFALICRVKSNTRIHHSLGYIYTPFLLHKFCHYFCYCGLLKTHLKSSYFFKTIFVLCDNRSQARQPVKMLAHIFRRVISNLFGTHQKALYAIKAVGNFRYINMFGLLYLINLNMTQDI